MRDTISCLTGSVLIFCGTYPRIEELVLELVVQFLWVGFCTSKGECKIGKRSKVCLPTLLHTVNMYVRTSLIVELQGNLGIGSNTEVVVDHMKRYIFNSFWV